MMPVTFQTGWMHIWREFDFGSAASGFLGFLLLLLTVDGRYLDWRMVHPAEEAAAHSVKCVLPLTHRVSTHPHSKISTSPLKTHFATPEAQTPDNLNQKWRQNSQKRRSTT